MRQISKTEFLEMFELKILNGSKRNNKEFTVTSRKKPSKRKKHYCHDADYALYLRKKNNKNNTNSE